MIPIQLSAVVYALPFLVGVAWAIAVLVLLVRIDRHLRRRPPRD